MSADRTSTPDEHKKTAPKTVGCFVLTVSDTKTAATDTSGALIRDLLTAAGHRVVDSRTRRATSAGSSRRVHA